jgi:indole-3-glycerol phosphate synthase
MNFLESILSTKREEVAERKRMVLRARLEDTPAFSAPRDSLVRALAGKDMAVIAEIKKASPSRNVIREDFNPQVIARQYLGGGACALSVLTDEKFFQGRMGYLETVRRAAPVPVLQKDFIIDPYQLYEARAYGADAVLLIAAALDRGRLHDLAEEAHLIGLESMVEVHTEEEIDALDLSRFDLIAINNRDLMTFETEILTTVRLRKALPSDALIVSESGIQSARDLKLLMEHQVHAVLIGELFMKAENPGIALRELLAGMDTGGA